MSNPTTLVSPFASDLTYTDQSGAGTWASVAPIRFDGGLWLEQAGLNYFPNPRVSGASLSPWFVRKAGVETITLDATPVDAANADQSVKLVAPGTNTYEGLGAYTQNFHFALTGSATQLVGSCDVIGSGTLDFCLIFAYYDDASQDASAANSVVLSSVPQRFTTLPVTLNPAKTCTSFEIVLGRGNTPAAFTVQASGFDIQESPATSHIDGDQNGGDGYDWSTTPDDGPSTRAASSASLDPTGILDPASGAVAFRVTPTIETGVEELWGECGVKGAGTDHLRWGRDASTHPYVEWSSNNAAYQRLTGSETLTAGTAYDLYFGHTGTVTSLAVDAGTLQTDTRAAVSGDFSTGDLTLEAPAGGVIYQPFAAFSRTLTAKEIATLNGKNNWTMKVLAGNPYINFQLRPY